MWDYGGTYLTFKEFSLQNVSMLNMLINSTAEKQLGEDI